MNIPRKIYYEKELQLRLSRSYGPGRYDANYEERGIDYPIGYVRWTERRNMQEFLRLLGTKAIKLDRLISHRIPIAEAESAYEIVTGKRREPYLGIVLQYPDASDPARVVALKATPRGGPVKLGVIGAGNFAKSVLLPRLAKSAQTELVGIATATGRNAKAIGEQYGFRLCTTDSQELLHSPQINTVLIATRHDTHAAMAVEAVSAGKTVYVEKPLAIDEESLRALIEAVEQHDGRVFVGFNRRFSSLSRELKAHFPGVGSLAITYRVNAGEIPAESWIQQSEGGGRIVGEVCHFIDYLQFLTDAEATEVFAYRSADGADTLSIVVKMSDGSIGNINYFATGDRALAKERVEVFGGGRAAVLDDFRELELWRDGKRKTSKRMSQDKGFDEALAAFLSAASSGAVMPIAWRDLVATTRACLQIEASLRSGRPERLEF